MRDQASALRQIVDNIKKQRARLPGEGARVLCVTSGKGGVGKTSIAVNTAISLAKKGLRVLLVDADFGLSNVDVMMGVTPPYDLSYVLRGVKKVRDIVADGPGGVHVVSGGSGINDLLNMTESQLATIMDNLLLLEDIADIIIMDTGAGITPLILRMITASEETIIITTPEPTAIMDSYALIKTIVSSSAMDSTLRLIVNRADSPSEAEVTTQKFVSVVRLYLQKEITPLGYVLSDPAVARGVRQQQPFVLSYPRSAAARNIDTVAWRLLDAAPEEQNTGFKRFVMGLFQKSPTEVKEIPEAEVPPELMDDENPDV